MRRWKLLIWAVLCAFFFVVATSGGLWLVTAPVSTGTAVVVDGVTVAEESSTDYTQLIIPGLVLVMGVLGLTGSVISLWRSLPASRRL